jgi:hypothetical protein
MVLEVIPEERRLEVSPPTFADIKLITGEQGSGKSVTSVAYAVGDYYSQMTGLVNSNGEFIRARCIDKRDRILLKQAGLTPSKFKYVRVYADNNIETKLIEKPKGWMVKSLVRIFANFHLYGIEYAYISLADILQYINYPLFDNAWILSDESVMNDARNSMEAAGKLGAGFGATIRKRNAHYCIASQYAEMIERRYRLFHTTKILCTYDKDTKYINLNVKVRGEQPYDTDFWEPQYRPFFDTREIIKTPQYKIDNALSKFFQTETAK